MQYRFISAADFTKKMQHDPMMDVIDIRSDFEYQSYNLIYPVTHVALHDIDIDALIEDRASTQKPLYVLCKMGPRAEKLCQLLAAHGQDDLIVIQGGITGCIESGAPAHKSDPFPSMEEIQLAVQESFQKFMVRFGG